LALKGLFYILIALAFSDWCLMMSFSTEPTNPTPSTGNVYPYNMHGIIVYITRREYLVTDFLTWTALLGLTGLVGFCAEKMEKIEQRRKHRT
jgi:hypothetical protein